MSRIHYKLDVDQKPFLRLERMLKEMIQQQARRRLAALRENIGGFATNILSKNLIAALAIVATPWVAGPRPRHQVGRPVGCLGRRIGQRERDHTLGHLRAESRDPRGARLIPQEAVDAREIDPQRGHR